MKQGKRLRRSIYSDLEEGNTELNDIFSEFSASSERVRKTYSDDGEFGFSYLLDYDDDELKLLLRSA